jgi:hypothetical protein
VPTEDELWQLVPDIDRVPWPRSRPLAGRNCPTSCM